MDLRAKELLVEKYWNGNTSIEEEQLLKKTCLTHPDIFSVEEQNLFTGMSAMDTLELSSNFGSEFLDKVEYEEAHEKYAVASEVSNAKVLGLPWKTTFMRIAATLLLVVGIGIGYLQLFSSTKSVASLSPAERAAFEESQKALVLIAQKMNKVKILSSALEKFDDAQIKIRN